METTSETIVAKSLNSCVWHKILRDNLAGIGTSFPPKPLDKHQEPCYSCNGILTEPRAHCYTPFPKN